MKKKLLVSLVPIMMLLTVCVGLSADIIHFPSLYAYADETTDSSTESTTESSEKEEEKPEPEIQTGDYATQQPPAKLATAYHDGYQRMISSSKANRAKQTQLFTDNIKTLTNIHFSNTGAMIGPVGLSNSANASNITNVTKVNKDSVNLYFGTPGVQYWTFGRAYNDLQNKAAKASPSSLGTDKVIGGVTGMPSMVANLGLTILTDFSPAPIILALVDSSVLSNASYGDNKFVEIVNNTPMLKSIISFFGDPAPLFPQVSMATMMLVSVIMFSIGLSLLTVFFNGRQFGMTIRKTAVKVIVVALAVPAAAKLYDVSLGMVSDVVEGKKMEGTDLTLTTSLALADWTNTGFALPDGSSLTVENNQFVFSEDMIKRLNIMSAARGGIISDSGAESTGVTSEGNEKIVAQHMIDSVGNNNETQINWVDAVTKGGSGSPSRPYYTEQLNGVADLLGANEEITAEVLSGDDSSGYIGYAGLSASGGGGNITYTMSGTGPGLTYTSAFNLLNTQFDQNGMSVRSNIVNPIIPTVAVGVNNYTAAKADNTKKPPNAFVMFILSCILLSAGFKALMNIITSGFGGMLHGGGSSVFGSSAGAGELIGAVIALIFGVMGLSLLMVVMQGVIGTLWTWIEGGIGNIVDIDTIMPTGLMESVNSWPWIGKHIADMIKDMVSFALTIVALFLLPKFIKIPIEAFGTWMASLPSAMAERASALEARFTGDHRTGGRGAGGHMASAAKNAQANSQAKSAAVKTGGAMLAGAGLRSILNKDSSKESTKSEDTGKPENPDGTDTPPSNEPSKNDSVVANEVINADDSAVDASSVNDDTSLEDSNIQEGANESIDAGLTEENSDDMTVSEGASTESISANESSSVSDSSSDTSANTSDSTTGDTVGGDNVADPDSAQSVSEAGGGAVAGAAMDANGNVTSVGIDSNNISEATSGDSVSGGDVAGDESVNSDAQMSSVETGSIEGNSSESASVAEGSSTESVSSESSVSSDIDSESSVSSDAISDASTVSAEQSVAGDTSIDSKSATSDSTDASQVASNKSVSADQSNVSANASVTKKEASESTGTSAKSGETTTRANRMADAIKSNGIVGALAGQGEVSAKEQAAVGAAHMAAGVMGMQGTTQHAVNNINARKGIPAKGDSKSSPTDKAAPKSSPGGYTEADIKHMEKRDAEKREAPRRTPVGQSTKDNGVAKNATNLTRDRKPLTGADSGTGSKKFFDQVSRSNKG